MRRVHVLALALVGMLALVGWLLFRPETPEDVVRGVMREYDIPGAVLAYGKVGEEPTIRGFGNLSADAVMPIASLSKPVTAEAILALIDQGKLTLDTRVGPATVRQLLQHQGGYDRSITKERGCEPLHHLDFTPGTRSSYSNRNYCWLGMEVERLTGKPVGADLGFRIGNASFGGVVGLKADTRTLFRFFSRRPHVASDRPVKVGTAFPGYRYGWMLFDDGSWGHWGSLSAPPGIMAIAVHTPGDRVGVVAFNRRPLEHERLKPMLRKRLVAVL